jgi:hypothetical protein
MFINWCLSGMFECSLTLSITAATHCSFEPPHIKAPEVLDMAVCCDSPYLLHLDDISSNSWVVFRLGELDIHNNSEYFSITGFVFSGAFLSCVC